MTTLSISGFGGANIALNPRMLPPGVGSNSVNQDPRRGDLRPIASPLQVATTTAGNKSIYRMGRDVVSDTQYWLSWAADKVHAVRGFIAEDTTERTYYTGDGVPKWTDNVIGLATAPYPTAWRQLGVPAPTTAVTLTQTGGVSTIIEDRFYVTTFVTDKGEESAPSPPSAVISCPQDAIVTINNLPLVPTGSFGIVTTRIYRTAAGKNSAAFLFLQDVVSTATTSTDNNPTLGNAIITTDWLPPPADLKYLTGLWNGMMAGISGRSICFCQPSVPYAWPIVYQIVPPDVTPVALCTFGSNLLVLTNGHPYVLNGSNPGAITEMPVDYDRACVSDKSPVSMGRGVVWACPDGLAYFGSTEKEGQKAYGFRFGGQLLTEKLLTHDDWNNDFNPTTMVGLRWLDYYIGFYLNTTTGLWNGIMVEPLNPGGIFLFDFGYQGVWKDTINEAAYVLDSAGVIRQWGAGAATSATFLSKVFHQPAPIVGFAWMEVIADAYPVAVTLYADGVPVYSGSAASSDGIRLPGGYYASDFQVKIVTSNPVLVVNFAHSAEELAKE